MGRIGLADLFGPLSPQAFLDQHWRQPTPCVGICAPHVLSDIVAIPTLRSCQALLDCFPRDVMLLGPDRFRAWVSPRAAPRFLERGYNLYFTGVEAAAPQAKALFADVAAELGVLPWHLSLEAFAGSKGGVSSRHYDNDINIQILLSGEKEWRIEPNATIQNPLFSNHPWADAAGNAQGFVEEILGTGAPFALDFNPAATQRFRTQAGTAFFVPLGFWHETVSFSDTWCLSLQVKTPTLADALSLALRDRLHRRPDFRRRLGVSYAGQSTTADPSAAERYAQLQAEAIDAVREMSLAEVTLATQDGMYRWRPEAGQRSIQVVDGAACLVAPPALDEPLEFDEALGAPLEKLVALKQPFFWRDAVGLATALPVESFMNFLEDLVRLGLLERGTYVRGGPEVFRPETT